MDNTWVQQYKSHTTEIKNKTVDVTKKNQK